MFVGRLMPSAQKIALGVGLTLAVGMALVELGVIRLDPPEPTLIGHQAAAIGVGVRKIEVTNANAAERLTELAGELDARMAANLAGQLDAALRPPDAGWLGRVDRIRRFLAGRPELNTAELRLLREADWVAAAAADGPLETEADLRAALAWLRRRTEAPAAAALGEALLSYLKKHDGRPPAETRALAPFLPPGFDPAVLARYERLPAGGRAVLAVRAPADPEHDFIHWVGLDGAGATPAAEYNIAWARERFAAANAGRAPERAADLAPHLKWPMSAEALEAHGRIPAGP